MRLYVGIDLHSTNMYVAIMDHQFRRIFKRRIANDLDLVLSVLEPYRHDLHGIAVESTYNWYWLVDGLMAAGYTVHLAHTAGNKQYEGIKHTDDKDDALFLAHLLALGILAQGYIYPKEDRPVRDLLRKRLFLVRQRTAHILSFQAMIQRHKGVKIGVNDIKKLKSADGENLFEQKHLCLSAQTTICCIAFLTDHIRQLEKAVKEQIKVRKPFQYLLTVPGIGNILGLTIMLEVGQINRFPQVGNFASYARCVRTDRVSNGKSKGKGNRKNGNRYLAWAFAEASHFSIRYNDTLRRYYQRKLAKTNAAVAAKAVSNKLARACYYIIKDQVPFRQEALFC